MSARYLMASAVGLAAVTRPPMALAQAAGAQPPAASAPARPNDYGDPATWLCRPGRKDACAVDNSTTIVAANGSLTREVWRADPNATVDCFYLYPTVSTDRTANSDMFASPAEINVVKQQFSRFASVCRPFAPLYRQITLTTLRRRVRADTVGLDLDALSAVAYEDVRNAWQHYLMHDNNGRGVVLIGHSQGAGMVTDLIRREIDGKPVQSRLVSAIIVGDQIAVPRNKDVGGTFQHLPLCRAAGQVGCIITFVSFRSTVAPPANSYFGRVERADQVAGCTNPAALGGGKSELRAYLDVTGAGLGSQVLTKPWTTPERPIGTPWVALPGLLSAVCKSNEHASGYLEITVHGNPADPRVDDIVGDLSPEWGLHLVEMNLTMGNLVDIVGRQATAYSKQLRR